MFIYETSLKVEVISSEEFFYCLDFQ